MQKNSFENCYPKNIYFERFFWKELKIFYQQNVLI